MNGSSFRSNADAILQLDDEALFGIIKKLACNGLRQILSGSIGPNARSSTIPRDGLGIGTSIKETITRMDASSFSEVIGKLRPEKKLLIQAYGFESLLNFDNCEIPLPFARWLGDHVDVKKSEIVVNNMCIPLSPQLVHDVLGIPMGGKTIAYAKSGSVKHDFLSVMGFNSLPSTTTCADNLLNDALSDDDFVRNFLIVAMVTFLCPNSNNCPSTKYLQPLIDVKAAKEWDWCSFVHFWLLNDIKKYNLLKKKAAHPSIFLGGCLYLICVVYLDFLDFGKEPLPSIFPRIKVWKGDMIKDYSASDCVEGQLYGKHQVLQFKCTCYAKRNSARTPPSCNIDGSYFKKTLAESVTPPLSPQSLDDVTALYLKHATSSNELVPVHVQSAILDLLSYFSHRTQTSEIPRSQDGSVVVAPAVVKEIEALAAKSRTPESEGHITKIDGHTHHAHNDSDRTLVDASVLKSGDQKFDDEIAAGNNGVHVANDSAPGHAPVCTSEDVRNESVAVVPKALQGGKRIVPVLENQKDTSSCDTLLLSPCEGYSSSVKDSITDTEIISSSSPTISDSVQLSQGGSLLKRKRVSSPITSTIGSAVAGRTRSRRSSLSPVQLANQPAFEEDPEAILRKKNRSKIATKMRDICQNLTSAGNSIDVGDDSVTAATKSSSFSSMVREDISSHKSRDLEPPYVNVSYRGPKLDASEYAQPGLGLPNPSISVAEKVNMWDFYVPPFNLLDEVDGSTHVASHNENLTRSNICDSQNNDKGPVYDRTPPCSHENRDCTPAVVPLAALDTTGHVVVISSQDSPPIHVSSHHGNESDVVITGERQFTDSCNRMAQEVDKIYDVNDVSCFHKCQRIGFNLGSSSKGKIGKSRRRRRIVQPNSYFRDFQVNVCNAKFAVPVPERQVYECVLFYSQFPERARDQVINYDNVRVTFEEFGSSMRRSEKTYVHNHVVNAFCRKLFKDKHPSESRKHFFFSPVGDYLMNHQHEGNKSYLHDNCERCFKLANGSFNFKSSDFLFFPIFHDTHWFVFVVALRDGYFVFLDSFFDEDSLYQKEVRDILIPNFLRAWDEFIHCDWNFHEFVVHYAAVPQQDRNFVPSKFDDGIFVMKFLELWDPCINMVVQFSSSNIQELRMLLVNSMIFSKHNLCNDAKNLVCDHKTMLALRNSASCRPLSLY